MTKATETILPSLLDSSLIITYPISEPKKLYTKKVIVCGDYIQVYHHKEQRIKKDELWEKEKNINPMLNEFIPRKNQRKNQKNELKVIEYKNVMRSKFKLQRLVKANEKEFKTFITLTFKENISDIKYANNCFRAWRTNISKKKKDFKYVCVPEFQKRGAVHYHLLTNLDIKKDNDIIKLQENKKNMYDVIYWKHGFSSVFPMKDINVVGYITKYMTKDIDNRLFGHRRYLASRNLLKPKVMYLDDKSPRDKNYLDNLLLNSDIKYANNYVDYFGDEIVFLEYKKNNVSCET